MADFQWYNKLELRLESYQWLKPAMNGNKKSALERRCLFIFRFGGIIFLVLFPLAFHPGIRRLLHLQMLLDFHR